LCRAQSNLGPPGSILLFYEGKSIAGPSQSLTAIGILEDTSLARSTKELAHLAAGRSVYSEAELTRLDASIERPVKVINYLLVSYIDPPIDFNELQNIGVFGDHPPQSIFEIERVRLKRILDRLKLRFAT
jgi:hypothetical protein